MALFNSLLTERVLEQAKEPVGQRLLAEYGSVFVARGGAVPPDRIIFRDQADVEAFQDNVKIDSVRFDDLTIELQEAAAEKLTQAVEVARSKGLTITPRGADSGRRSYGETVDLWLSRVEPALDHWTANGRLSDEDAEKIRSLSPFEQVPIVLSLEEQGIYFAKDLSKSILYSVAPPGTSQHLSMLAFDVAEFNEPRVREILETHFWYQTVPSDLPHFTFLGVPVEVLPGFGLKAVTHSERVFWVPDRN
jgi:hypothetical protein